MNGIVVLTCIIVRNLTVFSSIKIRVNEFLITTVNSAINMIIINFEDLLDEFNILMNNEFVISSIGESLNRRVYFNSDVLLSSIVRDFPNEFVHNGIQSGVFGVLLESVVFDGGILVGEVELLIDVIVGLFEQKDGRANAGNDVAFTLRLT